MGVFSRISDIINSNLNAILEKAEDPEKMVKMIILEMEQTLIDVRSSSAKFLADKKDIDRQLQRLSDSAKQWKEKAEIAVSKGRDDLATLALKEKSNCEHKALALKAELEHLSATLNKLEVDVSKLQIKLDEAVARRDAMVLRQEALSRNKAVKVQMVRPDLEAALAKFDAFERKLDQMEAEVEALDLGQSKSLGQQIDQLITDEKIDQELAEIKAKLNAA